MILQEEGAVGSHRSQGALFGRSPLQSCDRLGRGPFKRPPPPKATPCPLFLSLLEGPCGILLEMGRGWILSQYLKTQN